MIRYRIKSSNLYTVGYDTTSNVLEIEFKSGSVYQYYNVPVFTYEQLIKAPSAGRYFNKHIAYNFKYRLIENHSYTEFISRRSRVQNPKPEIDIKRLYKKLALRFHPDRSMGVEDVMKEINNLYTERNYQGLHAIALRYDVL